MAAFEISPPDLRELVGAWLAEDIGRGDVTTTSVVPSDVEGRARIEAREPCVVAGVTAAALCFELTSSRFERVLEFKEVVGDGDRAAAGDVIARIEGPLAPILTAERTALNLLARLCGVATMTRTYVDAVDGTGARIVDTRKTTPGLRSLQKHAVVVGGGSNHRFGLDDGILIKDNHLAAAGGVSEALRRARANAPHGLRIEVEVSSLQELEESLEEGAEAILLDNMTPDRVSEAVRIAAGRALLEVSGGINLDTVRSYAMTGVDLISVGALTHSAPSIDLALELEE
ncbi:MAG: carboxylating nicotinate-nucleotide diphosphorylase [Actinobacteria bacterium]|nr:carboxylating nicotinate-nucleotide diphosphorylase [Actinomycetota bacterium]